MKTTIEPFKIASNDKSVNTTGEIHLQPASPEEHEIEPKNEERNETEHEARNKSSNEDEKQTYKQSL